MLISPWKIFIFILISLLSVGLFSFAVQKLSGNKDELCFDFNQLQPCFKYFTLSEMVGFDNYIAKKAEKEKQQQLVQTRLSEIVKATQEMNSLEDSIRVLSSLTDLDSIRFWLPSQGREFWTDIFSQWDQLKSRQELYRILHHGDSQIEMDRITSLVRSKLQSRYGGSGPGFLPPWQLIPSYTVSQTASENWRRYIAYGVAQDRAAHNHYGAAGMIFYFDSGYANIGLASRMKRDSLVSRFETIKVLTGRLNNPLKISVSGKDNQFTEILQAMPQEQMVKWELTGNPSHLSVSLSGDTTAGILGVAIDGTYGIAMDNIPWRGSSGMTFTSISKASLTNTYKLLDVKMVILQFGGNSVPYIKSEESLTQFAKGFKRQIEHIRSVDPTLKIIVLGPADMSYNNKGRMESYVLLERIIEEMRKASTDAGAAFWSIYHAMGGYNSMVDWVSATPPLSTPDYIHFTQKGSEIIADLFYKAIEKEYEIYYKKKELDARIRN